MLEEYEPTEDEVEFKSQMLEFIKDPNAFERTNKDGHFTGCGWVCTYDGNVF